VSNRLPAVISWPDRVLEFENSGALIGISFGACNTYTRLMTAYLYNSMSCTNPSPASLALHAQREREYAKIEGETKYPKMGRGLIHT
jgi:hypothetical protein